MNTTVEVLGFAREPGWLPWAVQYFFLIGLSTAAFFVSLPGLVWRRHEWRGVSRRALLAALVCGLAAPVALLADLHQPGRFLNFYLHPNLGSWMAWGAFFIPVYLAGLLLYAWLNLRPALSDAGGRGGRFAGLYRALAYGGHDNPAAIGVAAIVAALGAALVLTYTGMEVMVVDARPLWNTPVLPLLFVVTALAGGLGLTGLLEAAAGKTAAPLLNRWLELTQWVSLVLLAAWLLMAATGPQGPAGQALASMDRGWLGPMLWLASSMALTLWLARRRHALLLPALLAVQGAWFVRWVVFMGGQSLPKIGATGHAYTLHLTPDSLLGIIGTVGLCLVLYIVLTGVIRWDEPAQA